MELTGGRERIYACRCELRRSGEGQASPTTSSSSNCQMVGCMPGPSVGVQATDGTIYFSCHGFGSYAFLYWSRDYGQTWAHSEVIGPDEAGFPGLNGAWEGGLLCLGPPPLAPHPASIREGSPRPVTPLPLSRPPQPWPPSAPERLSGT